MNIVKRYLRINDSHDTLQIYKLLKAQKYIIIVTLGWERTDKWIPGVFKNKRVRKALKINKNAWKRITENKLAFETKEEAEEIISRIKYHLANKLKEEDTSC